MGLYMVVLCAAGLGPSAIINMRDRVRVELPHKMKEREDELKSDVLQGLTDTYSAKYFPQIHRNIAPDPPRPLLAAASASQPSN